MDWGLKNRMSKIIRPDTGRSVMLAVDHGYFLGPTTRLEKPRDTIMPLAPYADVVMLTRGVLRTCVDAGIPNSVVLRVSGGSSIVGEDLSNEEIITSVEDALRLNASGIALSIFVGSKHEKQTLVSLSKLVDEGERYGMPVLAVTAVGKELGKRDARFLALSSRIAAELGAHIVKTYYCENFEKVVEGCPAPIVVAGGPKMTEKDALELTYNSISKGAVGVDMGRNIWQSDNPVAMIKSVRKIVHENATAKEAFDMFKELTKKK
ncbi:MAG TPA: 3-hydroxy-5-phosphonooxypentane-2,4-dione thiolase [Thermoplasmata archaeon]|nr:3-hydroxy-5-phosphonooxypentane-2,4-dione thiolase [Thermoplasmata archaeon]